MNKRWNAVLFLEESLLFEFYPQFAKLAKLAFSYYLTLKKLDTVISHINT